MRGLGGRDEQQRRRGRPVFREKLAAEIPGWDRGRRIGDDVDLSQRDEPRVVGAQRSGHRVPLGADRACEKRLFFQGFALVCPEPVLVK